MSTYPNRRLTRRRAERLLDPVTGRLYDCPQPLAAVLAAARAPAEDSELRAEQAALAAFRAACPSPVQRLDAGRAPQRRPSMIKLAIAKLMPIKIAIAAVVAAGAAGGVALAANAGVLPTQEKPKASSTSHGPRSGEQPGKPETQPSGKGNGPTASPASIHGLCNAFANVSDNPGKALENPAFSALIEAAGGKANVPAFCAAQPTKGPEGSKPTDKPGGKPTDKPGGKPTDKPGGQPTGRPGNGQGNGSGEHPTGEGR